MCGGLGEFFFFPLFSLFFLFFGGGRGRGEGRREERE
jgi:hypothetical protein